MYEFILKFHLPTDAEEPSAHLDALYEAGCDDATIGVGKTGSIALQFVRAAGSAEKAVKSAIRAVAKAIPKARLVEIGPDLVDLADLAELLDCTRQNLQKYASGKSAAREPFPDPIVTGNPNLYRLSEVLSWLLRNTELHPAEWLVAVAKVTAEQSLHIQRERLAQLAAAE